MNPHRRHRRATLFAFALIVAAVGSHRGALAKDGVPPRIECDVSVPCSAEEAWAAWTTVEGLESFLARSAKVTPEEGGEYVMEFGGARGGPPRSRYPRILQFDAPRTLRFEWVIPLPQSADRDPMTIVTVRIEPVSSQRCRVRLEHTGWIPGEETSDAYAYSKRAWKIVLQNLRTVLMRARGDNEPAGTRLAPGVDPVAE